MWHIIRFSLPLHAVLVLTNWLPDNVIFIRFRGYLARPFFKKCGKNLGIGRNVTFYNPSAIEIGDNVYIALGCWFLGVGKIVIHDEVMFGPYVVVSTANHTKSGNSFRFGDNRIGNIVIGKGSWVGAHSTLVVGANIGEGSVVAANSVLNTKVADNNLFGGVPAVFLKSC